MSSLPAILETEIVQTIDEATGSAGIVHVDPVGGGCVSNACSIQTDKGERFFLKWNPDLARDVFAREAEGLAALAEGGPLRVPAVLAASSGPGTVGWILMEYVPPGPPGRAYWRTLAEGMATLHAPTGRAFGWGTDNHIGPLPQVNSESRSWSRFWTTRRIVPQLRAASARGLLDDRAPPWPGVVERLPDLLAGRGAAGASLLHGDFWSGNVYSDAHGRPVLVDPAVYYGDGEVDLAMARLFGGFDTRFFDAYRESTGSLDPAGPIMEAYRLYPLLVHVNLFGGGYVQSALRLAQGLAKDV